MEKTTLKTSEEFKNRLLYILDEKDYSKGELSNLAGISGTVMARMTVYGIIPSTSILIKLADCLNYPLAYLLGESDEKEFYKSENPSTFHARLAELKEEKGTTYSKIAFAANFPDSYLHNWIKRESLPSVEFLKSIAKYFNVSMDYLLGRTDDRN